MHPLPRDLPMPDGMPVLSRGKHRDPSHGACFMEYTALLAGEPFTDRPQSVDDELAAVLRDANDKLSDRDRPLLVPLLGRAIGAAVRRQPVSAGWYRTAAGRRRRREQRAGHRKETTRLRRAVSRRFVAAVGTSPSWATEIRSGSGEELSGLFWDLMNEPTVLTTSDDYVRRLIDRLHLLHECYEEAMDELGLPSRVPERTLSTDEGFPIATEHHT